MPTDVLSKVEKIVEVAEYNAFQDSEAFALHLHAAAIGEGESSPFRLLGTSGGSAETITSVLTIRKHVEFCHSLHLVQYFSDDGFLTYEPLVVKDGKLHSVIAHELWRYMEQEGVSRHVLLEAKKTTKIHDPMSLWGNFPVRRMSRSEFRKCFYLLAKVSPELVVNRKWTYHFDQELH